MSQHTDDMVQRLRDAHIRNYEDVYTFVCGHVPPCGTSVRHDAQFLCLKVADLIETAGAEHTDLIETADAEHTARECRDVGKGLAFKCSGCGAMLQKLARIYPPVSVCERIEDMARDLTDTPWLSITAELCTTVPRYCPWCGARIVKGAEGGAK